MKGALTFILLPCGAAALVSGCIGSDVNGLVGAGSSLGHAATLSDADVNIMAWRKGSGVPVNAKVYMAKDVNRSSHQEL